MDAPNLKGLDAKELLEYPRGKDEHGETYIVPMYSTQQIAEIRRRLERAERMEKALRRWDCGDARCSSQLCKDARAALEE